MTNDNDITCPACGRHLPRAAFGTRPSGHRRGYCRQCESRRFVTRRKLKQWGRALKRLGL